MKLLCRPVISIAIAVGIITASAIAIADPVKLLPIAITASNTASGSSPWNVIDGDTTRVWNSGGWATQWIQFDLGRPTSVRKIRLSTLQSPPGGQMHTVHTVSVGQDPNHLTAVYTWDSLTSDAEWLEASSENFGGTYLGGGDIRYIRVTTSTSSSWIAWREIEVYGGLEYFGYYGDGWWGDNTGATTNAGANLVSIPPDSNLIPELAEAKSRGVHAMVDVSAALFSGTTLLVDWKARWQALRDAIVNGGYSDTVAAFYLFDEPYGTWRTPVTSATMRAVASQIQADFPTKDRATILNVENGGLSTCSDASPAACLDMFTWVGFDCYGQWNSCGLSPPYADMDTLNSILRSRLSPSQRLIAVPQATLWWANINSFDKAGQQQLIDVELNQWHQHIAADSKYVAVVPFLWNDGNSSSAGPHGAGTLPWISSRLYQLAYSFIGHDAHAFPTLYQTSYPENPPYLRYGAFDGVTYGANSFGGDTSTIWLSGNWAPGWISGSFPGITHVSQIYLTTWQDRTGPSTHTLYGHTGAGWITLQVWHNTVDSQQLIWTGSADIDSFELYTSQSPSWLGWRDIEILR